MLVAAMERGDQIFAAVLAPGDACPQLPRQPHQHGIFGGERHFLAETAADVGRDHAQIGFRKIQHIGDGGARQMRHLRRAGERGAAAWRIERRVRGACFQRHRILPARAHIDPDAAMCLSERGVEVGGLDVAIDHDIAALMDARRIGRERVARIGHRRRFIDFDLDAIGNVLGFGGGRRIDGGNRLADKAHHVFGQKRLLDRPIAEFVQHRPDRPCRAKLGNGDDFRPSRRADADDRPAATGLRTKRR